MLKALLLHIFFLFSTLNRHVQKAARAATLQTSMKLRKNLQTKLHRWLSAKKDCSNSSALAMELLQSCAKPSIYWVQYNIESAPQCAWFCSAADKKQCWPQVWDHKDCMQAGRDGHRTACRTMSKQQQSGHYLAQVRGQSSQGSQVEGFHFMLDLQGLQCVGHGSDLARIF